MAEPTRYVLVLDVDVANGVADIALNLFDEHGTPLAQLTDNWVTFCWTWKDLVEYVEKRWSLHGGNLPAVSRPSPYVDLT